MSNYLKRIEIEHEGWKGVYDNDEWSVLFKKIGDDSLFLRWTPWISDNELEIPYRTSNVSIYRDLNKPNEAYKEHKYVKFTGIIKTLDDYKTIIKYLNLAQ